MCNPTIGKVLEIRGEKARVLSNNRELVVNTELVKVKKDDYVFLAGDVAIEKISKKEAKLILLG